MKRERRAQLILGMSLLGAVLIPVIAFGAARRGVIAIHARMAEAGGWSPADLTVAVGEPLRLRLVADDVMHGFAVGQTGWPALDLPPGQPVETTLIFKQPGRYTFYCTRWCGLGHWRMRGVIEVTDPASLTAEVEPPLYLQLGIDLEAPRPPVIAPSSSPSAERGAALKPSLPPEHLTTDYYRAHTPAEAYAALRIDPATRALSDAQVWDVVAWLWRAQTTSTALAQGQALYAANCAACHGRRGRWRVRCCADRAIRTCRSRVRPSHAAAHELHRPGADAERQPGAAARQDHSRGDGHRHAGVGAGLHRGGDVGAGGLRLVAGV